MLLFSPYITTIEYSFIILNTVLEHYYESLLEFLFDKMKPSDVATASYDFLFHTSLLSSSNRLLFIPVNLHYLFRLIIQLID